MINIRIVKIGLSSLTLKSRAILQTEPLPENNSNKFILLEIFGVQLFIQFLFFVILDLVVFYTTWFRFFY